MSINVFQHILIIAHAFLSLLKTLLLRPYVQLGMHQLTRQYLEWVLSADMFCFIMKTK